LATCSIKKTWGEAIDLVLGADAGRRDTDFCQRYYLKSDLTPELRADLARPRAETSSTVGFEAHDCAEWDFPHVLDPLFGLYQSEANTGDGASGDGFDPRTVKIWIGRGGTVTPLHFDITLGRTQSSYRSPGESSGASTSRFFRSRSRATSIRSLLRMALRGHRDCSQALCANKHRH